MNDMFGIQVCRRLFESAPTTTTTTKRRRLGSTQNSGEGGMLANLIPESDTNRSKVNMKTAKKQSTTFSLSSSSSIKFTKSSVLADIGNHSYCKSPPRSNKELKEMRSSVMAIGFDKKDVSFSVFEMISQQQERKKELVQRRPTRPHPSAKSRHGRGSAPRPVSRVGTGTISVLAVAESRRYQGVLVESKREPISVLEVSRSLQCQGELVGSKRQTTSVLEVGQSLESQGELVKKTTQAVKRRGKRDRRTVAVSTEDTEGIDDPGNTNASISSTTQACSFENMSKGTKRSAQHIALDIVPVVSTKRMDNAKAVSTLERMRIRATNTKSKPNSHTRCEKQASQREISRNGSRIRELTDMKCPHSDFERFSSIPREVILEQRKPGGPGSKVLSAEKLQVPIHNDSSKTRNLTMVQSAMDVSIIEAKAMPIISTKGVDTTRATNELKTRKARSKNKESKLKVKAIGKLQSRSETNVIIPSVRDLTEFGTARTLMQDTHEQQKAGGLGCQALSVVHLDVPVMDGSRKTCDSSIVRSAVDISLLKEAANTLLQLSTSRSEDSDEDLRGPMTSIRKPSVVKRTTKYKHKTKRKHVEIVKRKVTMSSRSRSTEPERRRSTRQVVLTQRFSPFDQRRHKRGRKVKLDQSKAVGSNRSTEVTGDDNIVREPLNEHITMSPTAKIRRQAKSTNGKATRKGTMGSNEVSFDAMRKNVIAEPTHPPKSMNKLSNVVTSGELLNPVGSRSKSLDSSNKGEINRVVGSSINVQESTRKGKHNSVKVAEDFCLRKSTRCKTTTTHHTPPRIIKAEDDFFDSLQKNRSMKDACRSDKSESKQKRRSVVEIDKKQSTTMTKRTECKLTKELAKSELTGKTKKRKAIAASTASKLVDQRASDVSGPSFTDPDGWTRVQIASLRSAYATVNPCSNQFWEEIANQIEGRSEEECRTKWFALVKSPGAKKKLTMQTKGGKNEFPVQNMGNEDDLFNSTPMRLRMDHDVELHGNEDQSFDIDFGSPIVVEGGRGRSAITEYDDDVQFDAPTARFAYSRTFVKNLKRDISKAGKIKPRKKIFPIRDTGPKGISYAVGYDDLEVKGTLSPGGTMLVRTIDWNEGDNDDDIFGSDEE